MTGKPDETPLGRAQRFERDNALIRDTIIHRLRDRGWSRDEAIKRADALLSDMLDRMEAGQ